MLRTIAVMMGLMVALPAAAGEKELLDAAMKGDYQAQRNLAFGYATGGQQFRVNKGAACSWYLLILRSDSPKLNVGDVGNVDVYCGKLDADMRLSAEREANALYKRIYSH